MKCDDGIKRVFETFHTITYAFYTYKSMMTVLGPNVFPNVKKNN